ncbi:response regulator transcription factor [Lachnoclostridium phytofermentans]|uniref:Stage 0 sporulation protein A homolog n=1 Tax=Lachnoclostridium phytofermentans (strain ATCC 700394 / DSM 18823 / ISDg) TaxID=357809 RepID=A9KSV1_LACP7|nr:response regulator transcription factor [Lachnoclostridium phytofermentans]ABX40745.1 two component transcriptional regulator, winged helix family [Lachnoclostridium phytofermentans ISDg]
MKKILVVEDDLNINNMLREALEEAGYEVVQAYSGTEAMLNVGMTEFDLILLDLMLPGMSGEEFLKLFNKKERTPVIVLSAKDELDSKVDVLSCGADDYITKPFQLKELLVRIEVALRRVNRNIEKSQDETNQCLSHKDLLLNRSSYEVRLAGNLISLTKQEYKILELLLLHPNKVFSKQEIYNYAWEEYFIGEDKTINVHISNIRMKLKKVTEDDYIDTVWGIGFKLSK